MNENIVLHYGKVLVVFDLDIYTTLIKRTGWTVKQSEGSYLSVRGTKQPYVGKRLARLITDCPENLVVDHINGNPLDNRRSNLRIVTRSQNQYNREAATTKKSKLPKGVYLNKRLSNYYAQIRKDGERFHLGSYKTVKEAELAYIKAAAELHKEHAAHTSRSGTLCTQETNSYRDCHSCSQIKNQVSQNNWTRRSLKKQFYGRGKC